MEKIVKFVLQKHDAVRAGLHLDLRIQPPGKRVLYSFALPKAKVPKIPGERALAVRTNDHSHMYLYVDHLEIPKGNYGHGTINTIQKGNLRIQGWSDRFITFYSDEGEYLKGRYALLKFQGKHTKDENNLWVLIKLKDEN